MLWWDMKNFQTTVLPISKHIHGLHNLVGEVICYKDNKQKLRFAPVWWVYPFEG